MPKDQGIKLCIVLPKKPCRKRIHLSSLSGKKKANAFFFQFFSIRITLQDWQVQLSMYMILRRRQREQCMYCLGWAISSLIRGLLVASVWTQRFLDRQLYDLSSLYNPFNRLNAVYRPRLAVCIVAALPNMGANPLSPLYTEISIIAVELNCTPGGNKEAQETLCCWRLLRGPIILSKLEGVIIRSRWHALLKGWSVWVGLQQDSRAAEPVKQERYMLGKRHKVKTWNAAHKSLLQPSVRPPAPLLSSTRPSEMKENPRSSPSLSTSSLVPQATISPANQEASRVGRWLAMHINESGTPRAASV